jgi:hypothetical protein
MIQIAKLPAALPGGLTWRIYLAGTATPATGFSNASLTVAADSFGLVVSGEVPGVHCPPGEYDLVLGGTIAAADAGWNGGAAFTVRVVEGQGGAIRLTTITEAQLAAPPYNSGTWLVAGVTVGEPDTIAPTGESATIVEGAAVESLSVNLTLSATDAVGVTQMMISNAVDFAGASWEAYAVSKAWTLASGADGARTVYAKFRDAALNVSGVATATTTYTQPVDVTAPVITAFDIPATSDALLTPITTFTATDAVGVTGWFVSENAAHAAFSDPNAAGWLGSVPTEFTFAGEGASTLYAAVKDNAGNISLQSSDGCTVTLQTNVAPSAPVISETYAGVDYIVITVDTGSTDTEDGAITTYDLFVDGSPVDVGVTISEGGTYTFEGLTTDVSVALTIKGRDSGDLLSVASNVVNSTPTGAYIDTIWPIGSPGGYGSIRSGAATTILYAQSFLTGAGTSNVNALTFPVKNRKDTYPGSASLVVSLVADVGGFPTGATLGTITFTAAELATMLPVQDTYYNLRRAFTSAISISPSTLYHVKFALASATGDTVMQIPTHLTEVYVDGSATYKIDAAGWVNAAAGTDVVVRVETT